MTKNPMALLASGGNRLLRRGRPVPACVGSPPLAYAAFPGRFSDIKSALAALRFPHHNVKKPDHITVVRLFQMVGWRESKQHPIIMFFRYFYGCHTYHYQPIYQQRIGRAGWISHFSIQPRSEFYRRLGSLLSPRFGRETLGPAAYGGVGSEPRRCSTVSVQHPGLACLPPAWRSLAAARHPRTGLARNADLWRSGAGAQII